MDTGDFYDMFYNANINGIVVIKQLDPGTTHAFMSPKAASQFSIIITEIYVNVELRDG